MGFCLSLILFAFSVIFFTGPRQVASIMMPWSQCPAHVVNVKFEHGPAPVRNALDDSKLTENKTPDSTPSTTRNFEQTVGLYQAKIVMELESRTVSPLSSGMGFQSERLCVVSSDLTVKLLHRILLSKKLPAGSCLRKETLLHEKEHERIQFFTLDSKNQYMQALVRKELGEFKGKNQMEIRKDLAVVQDRTLSTMTEFLTEQARQAQAELDTPEEYRRVQQACSGR